MPDCRNIQIVTCLLPRRLVSKMFYSNQSLKPRCSHSIDFYFSYQVFRTCDSSWSQLLPENYFSILHGYFSKTLSVLKLNHSFAVCWLCAINLLTIYGLKRTSISICAHSHLMCSAICSPEPHAGFKIAFNMFDADGNQMVDKREFLVVSS